MRSARSGVVSCGQPRPRALIAALIVSAWFHIEPAIASAERWRSARVRSGPAPPRASRP